jgi:integrase/recombinase XerC
MNTKLYFRQSYENSQGQSPIYLRINHKGKVTDISLKIFTTPGQWNEKRRRVKSGDPHHVRKNKLLSHYEAKAIKIVDAFAVKDKRLTFTEFKRLFRDEQYGSQDFYAFTDKLIQDKTGVNEPNTIKSLQSSMRKLKTFAPALTFNDISLDFIERYEKWLKVERGNNSNSISKAMRLFKMVAKDALKNGLIEKDVFAGYKIRRIEGTREHLTDQEVKTLIGIYESSTIKRNMRGVLGYFLFACHTGLSYADIKKLRKRDIITMATNHQETRFVKIERTKTDTPVLVPLIPQAEKLIPDGIYYDAQKAFRVLTSQPTNRYLKTLMHMAGINKTISFHCARHTFATLCKSYGINYDVIAKYLGHTDHKTTAVYAKYETSLLISEMAKWNDSK